MVTSILLSVLAIAILLLIIVSLQSPGFRIERAASIAVPASIVFAQVNDFHNWAAWSPWEKMDPAMTKTFEGSPFGVGSIYSWSGNSKVGKGTMTILQSQPSELIRIQLQFFVPFKATNMTEFTFKPDGDQTLVTWAMTGQKSFMFKAAYLVMNMDNTIGKDFADGLNQLKTVSESARS